MAATQRPQRGRRFLTLVAVVALGVPAAPAAAVSTTPSADASQSMANGRSWNTHGIEVVRRLVQARPNSERQAQDLSDAQVFAQQHPDDVGYPWIDPRSDRLELSAASARGTSLLDRGRSAYSGATRIREVKYSYGDLEAIIDDIVTLSPQGVPDADVIAGVSQDHQRNRLVLWLSRPSERLLRELAKRHGTEAISVIVDPNITGGRPASRTTDTPPYYGGAAINAAACSDSFSWTISGTKGDAMLTAAHCASTGGNVRIGSTTSGTIMGTVTASSEENWSSVSGTQYYTGQGTYRGDVALIRLKSGLDSGKYIYRGGPNSNTATRVIGKYSRFSQVGEWVLVGGRAGGESGPIQVVAVNDTWRYTSGCGSNCWVRNIVRAGVTYGDTSCPQPGDSGGSVFHFPVSSSGVVAVGTFSGFWGAACDIVYTDIWHSYLGLPGDIWD
jgi:hypothetical protein